MPTFDTPTPVLVDAEVGIGSVTVTASERADVVVEVHPSELASEADVTAAKETTAVLTDAVVVVKGPQGWKRWTPFGFRGSIDVMIDVPTGTPVRVVGGVTHLRCVGDLGAVSFRTGVGDLRVDRAASLESKGGLGDVEVMDVAGNAEVKMGGSIRLGRVGGRVIVKNTNGNTQIRDAGGDARVHAANGSIEIERARASVVLKTANGEIALGEVSGPTVVAESACGSIQAGVPDGVAAWLDLATKFGHVQSDLAASERPPAGKDVVEIRARTSMGDISIRRVDAVSAGVRA